MSRVFQSEVNTNLHPSFFEFKNVPTIANRTQKSIEEGQLLWSQPGEQYEDIPMVLKNTNKINHATKALAGIQEVSVYSKLFFSQENINEIQKLIRYNIYIQSGNQHIIDKQNEEPLIIIMRNMYLQHGKIPRCKSEYKKNLAKLNAIVVSEVIPDLLSNVEQYIGYRRDISRNHLTIDRSINESTVGKKNLRSISDVLVGDKNFFSNNVLDIFEERNN